MHFHIGSIGLNRLCCCANVCPPHVDIFPTFSTGTFFGCLWPSDTECSCSHNRSSGSTEQSALGRTKATRPQRARTERLSRAARRAMATALLLSGQRSPTFFPNPVPVRHRPASVIVGLSDLLHPKAADAIALSIARLPYNSEQCQVSPITVEMQTEKAGEQSQ